MSYCPECGHLMGHEVYCSLVANDEWDEDDESLADHCMDDICRNNGKGFAVIMTELHWVKVNNNRWETEEGIATSRSAGRGPGWESDFVITYGGAYLLKMRSAKQKTWHDTLQEAKDYAASI